MKIDYAWEKFRSAVLMLVGNGTLQERLGFAFAGALVRLQPEDLPENVRGDFRFITDELRKVTRPGGEGVPASVRPLGEAEATAVAERIVSVYDELVRLHAKQYPSLYGPEHRSGDGRDHEGQ